MKFRMPKECRNRKRCMVSRDCNKPATHAVTLMDWDVEYVFAVYCQEHALLFDGSHRVMTRKRAEKLAA